MKIYIMIFNFHKNLIHIILFLLPLIGSGQHRITFSVAQSYSDDWQLGKTHTLEAGTSSDLRFRFKLDTLDCSLNFKHGAGAAYHNPSDDQEAYIRPTENDIFIEGMIKYPMGWKLDPYASASAQTQFVESFKYVKDKRISTSDFRDPITMMESLGFAYGMGSGKDFIQSRIGVTLKQIRADKFTQLTDDPKTPLIKERYRTDTGIQWKTETSVQLDSAASYLGCLDLFASFGSFDNWTVKFQNEFQFFIWRFFGIITKFDMIFDEKQKKGIQLKQSIRFAVGVVI